LVSDEEKRLKTSMSDQRRESAARNQDNLSGSKKLKFVGDKFSNFKVGHFVPKKIESTHAVGGNQAI
jgi:hypothetical protein